jgi:LysM repeat protein
MLHFWLTMPMNQDGAKMKRAAQRTGQIWSFEVYLRTGRRDVQPDNIEHKFNPYHDPKNGQFTFAPGGKLAEQDSKFDPTNPFDAAHPNNHTVYVVRRGDSLSRVAKRRKGLTVTDLAALNGISRTAGLLIGQKLKLPNQSYLEAGRAVRNNFIALASYQSAQGGRLPPNVAKASSVLQQVNTTLRSVQSNGYTFRLDGLLRTKNAEGMLQRKTERRSKPAQRNTGGADRLRTDDGGHYIALRFNGPRETFNHFAQNANFNRGAYRVLEGEWDTLVRAGRTVQVRIIPEYAGTSLRPSKLTVIYTVDGERRIRYFKNSPGGR